MPVNWHAEIVEQLDFYWNVSLRPRLEGLTDDECFWEHRSDRYTQVMSSSPVFPQSKMCTLAVELPESVVKLLGPTYEDAARHLAELAYVELFRQGQVSSGWAAEHLGISKDDFLELLYAHDVPYFDMSEEELRQQVEVAMALRKARSTS